MNDYLIFHYQLSGFMYSCNMEVYVYDGRIIINKVTFPKEIVLENVFDLTGKIDRIINQELFEDFEFEYNPEYIILDGTTTVLELYTRNGLKKFSIDNFKMHSNYGNNKKFYTQIFKIIKLINDYTKVIL